MSPAGAGPTRRSWPRAAAINLALVLGSVAVAIGAGEALVRLFLPQQLERIGPIYRPADTVGYERVPELRSRVNTRERSVELLTDRDGYRIGARGRIEAESRLLVLGDSFMEALQVPHEQSLAGLAEARLPLRVGRPLAVRNGGVSGYGPVHYLWAARRAVRRERLAAAVVTIFVGNDVQASADRPIPRRQPEVAPGLRWPTAWSRREVTAAVMQPAFDAMSRFSHLSALAWNTTERLRIRLGFWAGNLPWVFRRDRAGGPEWARTAEICAAIERELSSAGARTMFVVLPTIYQVHPEVFDGYLDALGLRPEAVDIEQPTTLLTGALRSRRLQVIEALPELRRAHGAGQRLYGRFDRHFTAAGHEVLYRLLEPELVALLSGAPRGTDSAPPRPR